MPHTVPSRKRQIAVAPVVTELGRWRRRVSIMRRRRGRRGFRGHTPESNSPAICDFRSSASIAAVDAIAPAANPAMRTLGVTIRNDDVVRGSARAP
jgi:hypothetical protein